MARGRGDENMEAPSRIKWLESEEQFSEAGCFSRRRKSYQANKAISVLYDGRCSLKKTPRVFEEEGGSAPLGIRDGL